MSNDKIEEIRARHEEGIRAGADDDRATLLAEVERLIRERDEARSKETDYREGFEEGWDAAHEGTAAVVEKLREALRWYADLSNHLPVERRNPGDPDPVAVFVEEPPIMSDGGRRAREALEANP